MSPLSPTFPSGSRTGENTFFVTGAARSGSAAARLLRASVGVLFADEVVNFTLALAGVVPEVTRAVEGPAAPCSVCACATPEWYALDGPAFDPTCCDMGLEGFRLDFAIEVVAFDSAPDFNFR